MAQIVQLQPIRYHYKKKNALSLSGTKTEVGLVAQDVQKVMPQAVTTTKSGYLMLNADPVIWSMVNAIKEQ